MLPRLAPALLLALVVGAATPAVAAPPDGARRRAPEDVGVREAVRNRVGDRAGAVDGADARPAGGDEADAAGERRDGPRFGRRAMEVAPAGPAGPEERMDERELHIAPRDAKGCPLEGYPRLVRALLALKNESQLMSLEVWGDAHEYAPYQEVIYYLRSPRNVFVTLFWVGPDGDIYVPFSNLRVPANRDVSVDPDSIIVPPLGREQWVAVATLEPLPSPCVASEARLVAVIAGLARMPSAIGRWEVWSKSTPERETPPRRR